MPLSREQMREYQRERRAKMKGQVKIRAKIPTDEPIAPKVEIGGAIGTEVKDGAGNVIGIVSGVTPGEGGLTVEIIGGEGLDRAIQQMPQAERDRLLSKINRKAKA